MPLAAEGSYFPLRGSVLSCVTGLTAGLQTEARCAGRDAGSSPGSRPYYWVLQRMPPGKPGHSQSPEKGAWESGELASLRMMPREEEKPASELGQGGSCPVLAFRGKPFLEATPYRVLLRGCQQLPALTLCMQM